MSTMLAWIAVGACALLQTTLFVFPQLLFKKKRHNFRVSHISHRGGGGENIENTMTAFESAMRIGTDMLELDVYLTKDKKVIVFHDGHLARTCGLPGHVRDIAYAELPTYKDTLRVPFSPSNPSVVSERKETIPLLRDVFSRFPNVPINLDVKDKDPELIEEVAKLIIEFQRVHITVCGSASRSTSNALAKLLPGGPRFFSVRSLARLLILFYTGLLPFFPIHEDFLEISLPLGLVPLVHKRSHALVLRALDMIMLNRLLFWHLRRRGIKVIFWVLNDEAGFRRAVKYHANGIMTDYPQLLRTYLDNPANKQPMKAD